MTMQKNIFVTLVTVVSVIQFSEATSGKINDTLIQLALFSGGNNSAFHKIREVCLAEQPLREFSKCLTEFFFGEQDVDLGTEGGRHLMINQLRSSFPSVFSNGESGLNYSNVTANVDFTQCGFYPACTAHTFVDDYWIFTCDHPIVVFIAVIGSVLSAIIIISNVLIISVTATTKSLRKPQGYFKLSLAVADLIAGIFVLPSMVHNTLNNKIDYSEQFYSSSDLAIFASVDETQSGVAVFLGAMGVLSTITAVFSLLFLSVDSFLSVMWPMQYRMGDIVSTKKAIIMVVVLWIGSILLSFLPILAKDTVVYGLSYYTFQYIPVVLPVSGTSDDDSAVERYPHALAYFVIVWAVPFIITWILTVSTSCRSRLMLKNMKEARRSIRSEKALNKVDRDLLRTVIVILTAFTITILPVFSVGMAVSLHPTGVCYNQSISLAFFFCTYIFICGRFLNVIIYNVFNKEFRTACNRFLARLCCQDEFSRTSKSTSGKFSGFLGSKNKRESVTEKSHTKETEMPSRMTSGSVSSYQGTPSSPTASKGEYENGKKLYENKAYTINETEEK